MAERRLTRRNLLTAGAAAMFGIATAHWPRVAGARGIAAPTLLPPTADVWGLSLQVEGTPAGALLSSAGKPVATARSAGRFHAELAIGPGPTPAVAAVHRGGASAVATYTGRVPDRPTARASLSASADGVRLDASASTPDPYTGAPLRSISWRLRGGSELGSGAELLLQGPWTDGEHYVTATVEDANARVDDTTVVFLVSAGRPAVAQEGWQPQWVQEAVVYGAIPPLFGQPPLRALTDALERLSKLGVNVLWLAPVFASAPGDFGYAVIDHFGVRADYGDVADLQALVAGAHARGIKVILDLPLNDTSNRHPYFRQAQSVGPSSHYWNFYERGAGGHATHYFNWRNLPNLDYGSGEVRTLAIEAAAHWVRVADVDGFRCDAAWAVQERAPDFWAQWRAELKRIRPDLLLLAEGSARESWPAQAGFAAAYDWSEGLGVSAWDHAFADERKITSRLSGALSIPDRSRPFRFLENNDTGTRFLTRYGPDVTRAAAALLLSIPGIPCIYTGQEIGAEYQPYRRLAPLDWGEDPHSLEATYRDLIARRLANSGLATGALTLVTATPAQQVLAYTVVTAARSLLVAVNFSAAGVRATVEDGSSEGGVRTFDVPAWSALTTELA
jgi:cyclomaltodextrinase